MRVLLTLALAVALAATGALAQSRNSSRTLPLTQDQAWVEVLKFLAAKGLTPTTADRANGRIVASSDKVWAAYIECPKVGKLTADYELTIMLAPEGPEKTAVILSLDGGADLVRRRHFLFVPGRRVTKTYDCPSTGVLEDNLFKALEAVRP